MTSCQTLRRDWFSSCVVQYLSNPIQNQQICSFEIVSTYRIWLVDTNFRVWLLFVVRQRSFSCETINCRYFVVITRAPFRAQGQNTNTGRPRVIGHGIGGKYNPIMARLAEARRWSKRRQTCLPSPDLTAIHNEWWLEDPSTFTQRTTERSYDILRRVSYES